MKRSISPYALKYSSAKYQRLAAVVQTVSGGCRKKQVAVLLAEVRILREVVNDATIV
jgi:hypothetical protein